ncbi:uncharacterized protein FIBRA_07103 [Fibroporia radiculosa]|uniref:SH3 domain-containing protein n=1 Tax=Fibroporia radiculosa TaxID=599839 RepID=J4IBM2_9APHY|nr:uncharacterized protein FIBRA_07103 [Fibroporia radiculosa]CCM04906.1 predicted protein [Fibroporia radiculosa]
MSASTTSPMISASTTACPIAASTSYPTERKPQTDEPYIPTLFCRVLYDYRTADASSLSFRKNDIVQVLTQLESGWWDGLLGGKRGWFPCNYVTIISDQEAKAALGPSEVAPSHPNDSLVVSQPDRNGERMGGDVDVQNYANSRPHTDGKSAYDFWVPQVSKDGRIFYVNTQTRQHSRDLPQVVEDDCEADRTGFTSPISALAAISATAGSGASSKRSHVPEAWVRRLADDGLSYYYVNKLNGTVSGTSPPSDPSSRNGIGVPRLRLGSATSNIHSDDSELFPTRRERSGSSADVFPTGVPRRQAELAPAEQLAQALQQTLTASTEDSPMELSTRVREAIASVTETVLHGEDGLRRAAQGAEVDQRVREAVYAVRDLLYVTATPSGHIPSHLYPREMRKARQGSADRALRPHLKGMQRKVAGTLSRLVLSALTMQYDPGLLIGDEQNRVESDIVELERAIDTYVTEVHCFQGKGVQPQSPSSAGLKRLYGTFSATNMGLGLPGAGYTGSWKDFGHVSHKDQPQPSPRSLAADQISELKVIAGALVERLGAVTATLKRSDLDPGGWLDNTICPVH